MTETSPTALILGNSLRAIRQEKSLSLSQTAALTGVSKAMLGQIERGESSPTIGLLWKLAEGLNFSFTRLLKGLEPSHAIESLSDSEQMLITPLFHTSEDSPLEMFDITLAKGSESLREAHQANVMEYIWVIEGELEVLFENEWHVIEKHKSVRFAANQPHGYRANKMATRFTNVLLYR